MLMPVTSIVIIYMDIYIWYTLSIFISRELLFRAPANGAFAAFSPQAVFLLLLPKISIKYKNSDLH